MVLFIRGSDDANNVAQNWHPSFGNVNNCDGGRSHTYCDYRQA